MGGPSARVLHPWVGVLFTAGMAAMIVIWFRDMFLSDSDRRWLRAVRAYATRDSANVPPAGKYNAGQKMFFWVQGTLAVVFVASGAALWFPAAFGAGFLQWMRLAHYLATLGGGLFLIVHVYLGTVAYPGTARAMIDGTVTERWARHHHPALARRRDAPVAGARRPSAGAFRTRGRAGGVVITRARGRVFRLRHRATPKLAYALYSGESAGCGGEMADHAKLFRNGGSQAVRLPKGCRFEGQGRGGPRSVLPGLERCVSGARGRRGRLPLPGRPAARQAGTGLRRMTLPARQQCLRRLPERPLRHLDIPTYARLDCAYAYHRKVGR